VSHACCGEPEPEVSAAPRGAAALKVGAVAASAVNALALAAAPTFALLALSTAFAGDRSDMLCMSMRDASPLNGMTLMYALMSAFHATPWLNLISRR
jgi:hypothetical protein